MINGYIINFLQSMRLTMDRYRQKLDTTIIQKDKTMRIVSVVKLFAIPSVIAILFIQVASAHPGGVDDNGGHLDRSTGVYHCHQDNCLTTGDTNTFTAPDTIKIATFNIRTFGRSKLKKPAVMAELANIIKQYDLVAIQEIKDISGSTAPKFLEVINVDGSEYDFIISERTGRNVDDKSSQEQYAYFYNTETIVATDNGQLFDDATNDFFQREPYIAHFRVIGGSFQFVLMSIHTKPGRAVAEIDALKHVFSWAQKKYDHEDDFIALGDFNAGCNYASNTELDALDISGSEYLWIVPHSADTNFSDNSACAYDRIVITDDTQNDFASDWGIDSVSSKHVSDHFPVWARFHTTKD